MSAALSRFLLLGLSVLYPLSLVIWLVFFVVLGGTADVAAGTPEQVATLTRFRYWVWLYPGTIVLSLAGGWWLQGQGRFLGATLVGAVSLLHFLTIIGFLVTLAPASSN